MGLLTKGNKVYFGWLKSIIIAYRSGEITRERFIHEYGFCQKSQGIIAGGRK